MLFTVFATVCLERTRSALHGPGLTLFRCSHIRCKLGRLVQNLDCALLLCLFNLQTVFLVLLGRLDKLECVIRRETVSQADFVKLGRLLHFEMVNASGRQTYVKILHAF